MWVWANEESRNILEFQDERAELLLPRGGRYGEATEGAQFWMPLIPIGQAKWSYLGKVLLGDRNLEAVSIKTVFKPWDLRAPRDQHLQREPWVLQTRSGRMSQWNQKDVFQQWLYFLYCGKIKIFWYVIKIVILTMLKYVIQWHWWPSQDSVTITTISKTFSSTQTEILYPLSNKSTLSLPSNPGNIYFLSLMSSHFWTFHINGLRQQVVISICFFPLLKCLQGLLML